MTDEEKLVTYEPPVVKRPKDLKALSNEFEVGAGLSFIERAASFFDFLARRAPYQFCSPALAVKVVYELSRMPHALAEDSVRFRDRGGAIRKALGRLYNRGLVVERGLMRATVDDDDLATTQQVRQVERIRSSVNAARETHAMLDVNKVRDAGVRRWLKGGVSPLLKHLQEDDRIYKLLPARKEEEE